MHNSLKQSIQKLVDSFASDLEGLVRQAAVNAVTDVLGGPAASHSKSGSSPVKVAPRSNKKSAKLPAIGTAVIAKAAAPKAARPGKAKGTTRIRRSDSQIDALAAQINDYVASHPGQRAEQIKAALKINSGNWGLPIKRLLDSGRVVAKGEKRATTYQRGVARAGK